MTEEAGDKKGLSKGCWKAALAVIGVYVVAAAFCIAAMALSDKDSAEPFAGEGIRFTVPPIHVSPPALEDPIEEALPTSTWPITPVSVPDSPTPPLAPAKLPDGWTRHELPEAGVAIALPPDWDDVLPALQAAAALLEQGAEADPALAADPDFGLDPGSKAFLENADLFAIPTWDTGSGVPLQLRIFHQGGWLSQPGVDTTLADISTEYIALYEGEARLTEFTNTREIDGVAREEAILQANISVGSREVYAEFRCPADGVGTYRPVFIEIIKTVEELGGWVPVEELDDGVRYESIDAGLSITLPGDWIVIDDEEKIYTVYGDGKDAEGPKTLLESGDLLAVQLPPEDSPVSYIPLTIACLPQPVLSDFEDLITDLAEHTARTGDYDISVGPEFISLPAGEAARVEFTQTRSLSDGSEQTVTLCQYYLVVDETLIMVSMDVPGTLIDTYRPVLAEIMESIEDLEAGGQ